MPDFHCSVSDLAAESQVHSVSLHAAPRLRFSGAKEQGQKRMMQRPSLLSARWLDTVDPGGRCIIHNRCHHLEL
jgi:hypothetical protein